LAEGLPVRKRKLKPRLFDDITRALSARLIGRSYSAIAVLVCYFIVGDLLRKNTIPLPGGEFIDTRLNAIASIRSGRGKRVIKSFLTWLLEGVAEVRKPGTLHPQQLFGKVVHRRRRRGSDVAIKNPGYAASPYVIVDEARSWFERFDRFAGDFWSIVNQALDPYGSNAMEKTSVEDLPEERMRYNAECSLLFFIQPIRIVFDLIPLGVLRRFVLIVLDVSQREMDKILKERVRNVGTGSTAPNIAQIRQTLCLLRDLKIEWVYTEAATRLVSRYASSLRKYAKEAHVSTTAQDYADTMDTTWQNLLLSMSAIQAAAIAVYGRSPADFLIPDNSKVLRNQVTVDSVHVGAAYRDLKLFVDASFEFVERLVIPRHSAAPSLAMDREVKCLRILSDKGCTSQERSCFSIHTYQEAMRALLGCSSSVAQKLWAGMRKKGFVDGKQTGRTDSKAWITTVGSKVLEEETRKSST
jgi:hypothetical protein